MRDISTDLEGLISDPMTGFAHHDPAMRRLAVSASHGQLHHRAIFDALTRIALTDENERVRAEATEALGGCDRSARNDALESLLVIRVDESSLVVEAAATAYGELGDTSAVEWLIGLASGDGDTLAREAGVAALGAIGDDGAIPCLVELAESGPPQVRRRAIVALSVFDGPEVETAVRAGLEDRNPMVREAAEMVVGETIRVQLRPPDRD